MTPKVDTGEIIGVKRFAMSKNETVKSLSNKTYKVQLLMYKKIFNFIVLNNTLPVCGENWKRKPYQRKDLEELATID